MSFAIRSGNVTSGTIGNAAVLSGSIGSGQIGSGHFASGLIAGLQSGGAGLVSGQVTSGFIGNNAVNSGNISSGAIGTFHFSSGAIIPGAQNGVFLAAATEPISGIRAVTSFFASVSGYPNVRIAMPDIGLRNTAIGIVIDNIASGQPCTVYTAGNIFLSGLAGLGVADQPVYLVQSGVLAGSIPAGLNQTQIMGIMTSHSGMIVQIGPPPQVTWLNGNEIFSGTIPGALLVSGAVSQNNLGNSLTVDFAKTSVIFDKITTAETISGGYCVAFMSGSALPTAWVAMAGQPDRMPAVGVCVSGALSGQLITIARAGMAFSDRFQNSGWFTDFPNTFIPGAPAYVGMSGEVTVAPRLFLSGAVHQPMGVTANFSGLIIDVGTQYSGSVGPFAISSGAIMAGNMGVASLVSGNPASGVAVDVAYGVWMEDNITTTETISGLVAGAGTMNTVAIAPTNSGLIKVRRAMAGPTGTIAECIGVITTNALSGEQVRVLKKGILKSVQFQFLAAGNPVFLGISGGIAPLTSGVSGMILQQVGTVITTSGAILNNDFYIDPTPVPAFGNVAEIDWHRISSGGVYGFGQSGLSTPARAIASGSVGGFDIANKAIASGQLDTAFITSVHIAAAGVLSGNIAAGNIGRGHLGSGTRGYGTEFDLTTAELISGLKAVALVTDTALNMRIVRAERQSGLRLPAIGVTISGAASGGSCTVVTQGFIAEGVSGMIASGTAGRILYVGSGGLIVNTSGFAGGASSGAHLISGSVSQKIGVYTTDASGLTHGIFVMPSIEITSGVLTTAQGNF